MIIYIALREWCEGTDVCAVFTNKEKADQYANAHCDISLMEADTEDPDIEMSINADKIFRVELARKKVDVTGEYSPNEYYRINGHVYKVRDGHYYTYVICKDISSAIEVATERFDTYLRMEKKKNELRSVTRTGPNESGILQEPADRANRDH